MVQLGSRPDAPTHEPEAVLEADIQSRPVPEVAPVRRRGRYRVEIPINPVYLPYLGLMVLAAVLRFWDLGDKALHHDESLHAVYSWFLYQGRGYVHDPMMHGPLLFELNALTFLLLGASNFTARLVPAMLGVGIVGMPVFLRRELGGRGAIVAAALLAVSPSYLYFSRFLRHDIYVDVFTLAMVIGVFRYLASGRKHWFYVAVVAASLLFATKEDFYISGVILFAFLAASWFVLRGTVRAQFHQRVASLGWQPWANGVVIFLGINVVLFTTFFTNMRGLCTAVASPPLEGCAGATGALQYWFQQQSYARGGQPWFYYVLLLLPLYEFLPVGLALIGLGAVRRKNLFFWFCVTWAVVALVIYSWAGEKMPWMLPQMALPFILLAGRVVGQWVDTGWGRRAVSARGAGVAGLVLFVALAGLAWVGLGAADSATPLERQTVLLQRLALSVAIALAVAGLARLGLLWGRRQVVAGLACGLLVITTAAYVRTGLFVTFDHPDTPDEPLIYVQSTPDVVFVTNEIARVSAQTGQGTSMPILLDNGWNDGIHEAVAWPFEWYLRDYASRRYFTKTFDANTNLADYPVILVMAPNIDPIQSQLTDYVGRQYKLNSWFPEDYKDFVADGPKIGPVTLPGLHLDLIWKDLTSPTDRLQLLKFLVYRDPPGQIGSREFYFFVRKDIPQVGPAPAATGPGSLASAADAAPSPAPQQLAAQPQADGSVIYGRSVDGVPQLSDPKDVAVGADGRLYVVEGKGNRVDVLNKDGSLATTWGGSGTGDGQFQEPWGISVAPNGNVYVADTWNHRVQYFDSTGKFLGTWGHLGQLTGPPGTSTDIFWGPRSIAVSQNGEVYVTDTGNKRVEVFSPEGVFLRAFGGEGDAPGQFQEPVGLALDKDGTVWVADAWNSRIQHLSPTGEPIGAFQVPPGWENKSVTNKPYLTVDALGNIHATSPDANEILTLSQDGRTLQQSSLPQGGQPVGISTAPDGNIVVADARNGVVVASPVR